MGDEVFGDLSDSRFGAFAEYTCATEVALSLKPASLTFEEAAAIPSAATTALQGLRNHGDIQAGQQLLINGASGGVGTFAIQLAKVFGANITAVCSTRKMKLLESLGVDAIIDYQKEDFTKNGRLYDVIFAVNGYHPIADYRDSLNPQGIYVTCGGSIAQLFDAMLKGPFMSRRNGKRFMPYVVKPNANDLDFLKQLVEEQKIKPVIDKPFHLKNFRKQSVIWKPGKPGEKLLYRYEFRER